MGSIPLPALDVRQTAGEPPLQNLMRAQTLAAGEQQQELVKRQIADQDAMTRALHDWDASKGDYGALSASVLRNGGSGNAAFQVMQHGLAVKKQVSDIAKQDAETGSTQLANLATRHDQALGAIKAAEDVPDDQLGAHVTSTVSSLVQSGMLKPEEAQPYAQLAQLPPDQMRAQLKLHEKQLTGEKAQIAQATAEVEQAKNKALTGEAEAKTVDSQANAAKTQEETKILQKYGGASAAQLENKYLNLDMQRRRHQPMSEDDQAFLKSYEHMKTLVPVANLNMQAALLNPQAKEMAAQLYQQTGQLPSGMRSPAMSAGILNQAASGPGGVPDIATAKRTYQAESALQKSATSGKIAQNITAYNTAIAHAQQLQTAADALDNGDTRALNSIGNKLGYEFGSDKTTNFNVIKNALSGEISKVFKGGEATDAEIKAVQEPFSAANSPKQLRGAIKNAVSLMNSKRDAIKQQYEQGMKGQPNFSGEQGGAQSGDPFAAFGGKAR